MGLCIVKETSTVLDSPGFRKVAPTFAWGGQHPSRTWAMIRPS